LGVRPTLPVEDIVLLFGIDLAGDKAMNDLEHGSTSSSFRALISCSLVRRSLLTYLIVGLRTRPSLIDLWSWIVSRWDV
jgi:hypothetical protein